EVDVSADLTATLALSGPLGLTLSGSRAIAKSGSVDWVDPFVGARLRQQLAAGQEFVLRGDVGGFGAGSRFSWQAIATYNSPLCEIHGIPVEATLDFVLCRRIFRKAPADPDLNGTTSYTDR